ncbi:MAG: hypothetical protein ACJAZN_001978 [Planctomycetota bacterium]|jgi:hypothetical protein
MKFPSFLNSGARGVSPRVSLLEPLLDPLLGTLLGAVVIGSLASCDGNGPKVIQGSGPVVREQRTRRPIERIHVEGYVDLSIEILPSEKGSLPESNGPDTLIFLEGASDLLGWVETELEGDILRIRFRDGVRLDPLPSIEVQTGHLVELSTLGSGDVHLRHVQPLATRGAALALKVTGSGDIHADGALHALEIQHIGSGDLDLRKLISGTVTYSGLGSGDAALHVEETLTSSLNGSGDLTLYGPVPEERVTSSVLGSCELIRIRVPR